MDNKAGINYSDIVDRITLTTQAVIRSILILLLISFILSLLFIIVQNYVMNDDNLWILTATYINIVIITIIFGIYARSLYTHRSVTDNNTILGSMQNINNNSYVYDRTY
jgi:hypothetical protein